MSQLQQAGFPSTGQPQERIKFVWPDFPDFVQLVLSLTVQAYQAMRKEKVVRRDWEEDQLTARLAKHLQPIALEHAILVDTFKKVITEDMRIGKQTIKQAKEIDLSLFGSWRDYDTKYFVWEAKRVGDKRVDHKYSILNSEYVNEAIYRFIRREYADGLSDAGVLGYVLAGSIENIVQDINQTMGRIRKNSPLPESDYLKTADPLCDFEDVYRSQHTRTDDTDIQLHHLLLSFDFSE